MKPKKSLLIEDKAEQPLDLPVKKEKRQHKKLSINEIDRLLEEHGYEPDGSEEA